MDSVEVVKHVNTSNEQLKKQLEDLREEQNSKDRILSRLIEEKNSLQDISQGSACSSPDKALPHYHYILPLVKDIHFTELRLKEQQREYEKLKLQCEAARLGKFILADSFDETECVLKRWSRELREINCKAVGSRAVKTGSMAYSVTNITYHSEIDQEVLHEELGFTVLCEGVHVRVVIKSQLTCPNMHMPLSITSARVAVDSDNFVPKLDESVKAAISQGGQVSRVTSLVSQHIQEDMAPYVIIIPIKKKAGKNKAQASKIISTKDTDMVKIVE